MKRRVLAAAAVLALATTGLVTTGGPAGATTVDIIVRDSGPEFDPAAVTVNNGDWVHWVPAPQNTVTHNVTAVPPTELPVYGHPSRWRLHGADHQDAGRHLPLLLQVSRHARGHRGGGHHHHRRSSAAG